MPAINQILIDRNKAIESSLLNAAEGYYREEDLRWFFTYAHGQITKQINASIALFENPDDLIRLNIHFAETFLTAVNGKPHKQWVKAFEFCKALEKTSKKTMWLMGEAELCGARMARVHIMIDLSNALKDVGCITPNDYGNMLIFINRGSLIALTKLRGRVIGSAETIFQGMVDQWVDMEVKAWRNTVYEDVCKLPAPGIEPNFTKKLNR